MLDCLLIDPSGGTNPVTVQRWISGADLLKLAEYALGEITTNGAFPKGQGTFKRPWVMDGSVATWLAASKNLRQNTHCDCYFYICGRIVKKIQKGYYMVDAGGTGEGAGRAWDQKIVWTGPTGGWVGEDFERGGPSYRNFSTYMDNIRRNSKNAQPAETWSQAKAEKLRRVLTADPHYAAKLAKKGDWTTGQVLPVLAATMFLAEPARNIRAFLANKYLLDMIEAGVKYGGRRERSSPKHYNWNKVLWQDPHEKGGKMPAAMTGSGAAASPIAPSGATGAKGTGAYTQAKEVTLICRYFTFGSFEGTNQSLLNTPAFKQLPVTANPVMKPDRDLSTDLGILGYVKYLMHTSIKTWQL